MSEVLSHPNPALKQTAERVDPANDPTLRDLCKSMAKTMYEAPGVGLAATQVGVMKRVIVYDIDEGLVALCNPEIIELSDDVELDDEGCLSLPGITVPIERSVKVLCEATSLEGKTVRFEATDLHARVLQHEIDHLDGVLIIDRASPEERKEALRRYIQMQAAGVSDPVERCEEL